MDKSEKIDLYVINSRFLENTCNYTNSKNMIKDHVIMKFIPSQLE